MTVYNDLFDGNPPEPGVDARWTLEGQEPEVRERMSRLRAMMRGGGSYAGLSAGGRKVDGRGRDAHGRKVRKKFDPAGHNEEEDGPRRTPSGRRRVKPHRPRGGAAGSGMGGDAA